MSEYGDFVTNKRVSLKYTLRKFCLKFGYDCGNFSKMERGLLNPYSGDKLEKLSRELELGMCEKLHFIELSEKELQPLQFENRKLKEENNEMKGIIKKIDCSAWLSQIHTWTEEFLEKQ